MGAFEEKYNEWLKNQIDLEKNPRRKERLEKGLLHGTVEFLRSIWFAAVGNFDHLHPEWELRDSSGGYRYIDLAYLPPETKGGIEVQGFASHARDLDVKRFKDLCKRQSLLSLDGWTFLYVAYPSITEEPEYCRQLVLSFIGKFMSTDVSADLSCFEAETVRFARRVFRPFTAIELAAKLRVSDRHARRILKKLVEMKLLDVTSGQERARTYMLRVNAKR